MATSEALLVPQQAGHLMFNQVSPEELKIAMAHQKALADVMIEYMRDGMVPDVDYYWLNDKDKKDKKKPALSKSGALNLCSLFRVIPIPDPDPKIHYHGNGHMTVIYRTVIQDQQGRCVAVGDGMASTLESKYNEQARWIPSWKLRENGYDEAALPENTEWEERQKRDGSGTYKVYKIEVPQNPADFYNTVLKIGQKRSTTEAALKLPLASRLFTQDIEDVIDTTGAAKKPNGTAAKQKAEPKAEAKPKAETKKNGETPIDAPQWKAGNKIVEAGGVSRGESGYVVREITGGNEHAYLVKRGDHGPMCTCSYKGEGWCAHLVAVSVWVKTNPVPPAATSPQEPAPQETKAEPKPPEGSSFELEERRARMAAERPAGMSDEDYAKIVNARPAGSWRRDEAAIFDDAAAEAKANEDEDKDSRMDDLGW